MPKYHVQIVIGGRLPVDSSREFLEDIEAISAFWVDLKPRSSDPMSSWTDVPLGGHNPLHIAFMTGRGFDPQPVLLRLSAKVRLDRTTMGVKIPDSREYLWDLAEIVVRKYGLHMRAYVAHSSDRKSLGRLIRSPGSLSAYWPVKIGKVDTRNAIRWVSCQCDKQGNPYASPEDVYRIPAREMHEIVTHIHEKDMPDFQIGYPSPGMGKYPSVSEVIRPKAAVFIEEDSRRTLDADGMDNGESPLFDCPYPFLFIEDSRANLVLSKVATESFLPELLPANEFGVGWRYKGIGRRRSEVFQSHQGYFVAVEYIPRKEMDAGPQMVRLYHGKRDLVLGSFTGPEDEAIRSAQSHVAANKQEVAHGNES